MRSITPTEHLSFLLSGDSFDNIKDRTITSTQLVRFRQISNLIINLVGVYIKHGAKKKVKRCSSDGCTNMELIEEDCASSTGKKRLCKNIVKQ